MFRALSLATACSVAFAIPVFAEDAKIKVDPGAGPTSTISDRVPQMKSDAKGSNDDGSSSANLLPAAKAMNDAVPSMRPGDSMSGQLGTKSSSGTRAASAGLSLSVQEGESWIKKPVYSNDGKKIGSVASLQRDADNKVVGMHADIGGYFGFGRSRVNLTTSQFRLQGDRVELDLTAAEVKALPVVRI
jgi:hypothetical protein